MKRHKCKGQEKVNEMQEEKFETKTKYKLDMGRNGMILQWFRFLNSLPGDQPLMTPTVNLLKAIEDILFDGR